MKHFVLSRGLVTGWFLLLVGASVGRADNWPQWRGPQNDGVCKETNLPTEWSATKNIVWKLPMPGSAGSTPVIWGDRIFLTSEADNDVVLLCLSTEGRELWQRKLGTIGTGRRSYMRDEGNNASASPSTDGKHVYTFDGLGDFACFDFDGNEVWRFNAQERYGKFQIQHGMHVTPLLDGERLYLSLLHSGGHWVIAIDKATGKNVWKVERSSDCQAECEHSYASPFLWRHGSEAYLVVHGNDYATAHRLADGAWAISIPSPSITSRFASWPHRWQRTTSSSCPAPRTARSSASNRALGA